MVLFSTLIIYLSNQQMQRGFMYCNYTTMKSMHVSAIPWMFGPKGANESCVGVCSEIFLEGKHITGDYKS